MNPKKNQNLSNLRIFYLQVQPPNICCFFYLGGSPWNISQFIQISIQQPILIFIFYSCKYLFYVLQCLTCFLAWYLNDYYQEWPLYWLGGSYLHIIQHEDKEYSKWCQEISSRKNVRIFVCSNFFPFERIS